tara:strand:- start:137 stop:802 length:666 start_codon:yes stop_codon:yes gene_type:complete
MDHDLAELLDLLGSRVTLEDRLALTELVPKEDTCTFTFTIKKIKPASTSLKKEKPKGDILVSGRLVDSPTAANPGHLRNRSNQKIELFIPKKLESKIEDWGEGCDVKCSGHLQGWNAATRHYQFQASKIHGDPLGITILIWAFKIIFIYPIWIPCWLIYKTVYVAIPVGLILLVVGEWQNNGDLSRWGLVLSFGFGITGLMLRLYVWAITAKWQAEDLMSE